MEENEIRQEYGVGKDAISVLNVNVGTNLVCTVILIVVTALNTMKDLRAQTEISSATFLLLAVCAGLCVLMIYRSFAAAATKRRLSAVKLVITNDGVSGVSMPRPGERDFAHPNGRAFEVPYERIRSVGKCEIMLTRKQPSVALTIETEDETFTVPCIDDLLGAEANIQARI